MVYSVSNDYRGMVRYKNCTFQFSNLCTFGWDNNGPAYVEGCSFIGEYYTGVSPTAQIQPAHGATLRGCTFSGHWNPSYFVAMYQTAQPGGSISDCDLSGIDTTGTLVEIDKNNNSLSNVPMAFYRCNLPNIPIGQNSSGIKNRVELFDCYLSGARIHG